MTSKKRTAPVLAHKEAAGETAAFGEAAISVFDYTTTNSGPQVRIADYLHRGQENALSRRELEGVLQMDGREIRRQIEIERRRAQEILVTASTIESAGGCL